MHNTIQTLFISVILSVCFSNISLQLSNRIMKLFNILSILKFLGGESSITFAEELDVALLSTQSINFFVNNTKALLVCGELYIL